MNLVALLTRRSLRYESAEFWSPSIAENDRIPPGISVDNSLSAFGPLASARNSDDVRRRRSNSSRFQWFRRLPDRHHSGRLASEEGRECHLGNRGGATHRAVRASFPSSEIVDSDVQPSLKTLLESRPDRSFIATGQPGNLAFMDQRIGSRPTSCRSFSIIRRGVAGSYSEFEIASERTPEIWLLVQSTVCARSLFWSVPICTAHDTVSDSPHVFVVASDDANIYFRKVHGQIELVRVLPVEMRKAERFTVSDLEIDSRTGAGIEHQRFD